MNSDIFQYATNKTIRITISTITNQQFLKSIAFIIISQNKPSVWSKYD